MIIRWTEEAHVNLEDIVDQAFHRDPLEASNISKRIEIAEKNILLFPKAALYNSEHDYYERYVPRTRVILVYRVTGETITVYRAFHTSRDPKDKA